VANSLTILCGLMQSKVYIRFNTDKPCSCSFLPVLVHERYISQIELSPQGKGSPATRFNNFGASFRTTLFQRQQIFDETWRGIISLGRVAVIFGNEGWCERVIKSWKSSGINLYLVLLLLVNFSKTQYCDFHPWVNIAVLLGPGSPDNHHLTGHLT
jgi:D-alanyl-lipoteichoic acid acyltransferase DltB (MBOAT superfamily)